MVRLLALQVKDPVAVSQQQESNRVANILQQERIGGVGRAEDRAEANLAFKQDQLAASQGIAKAKDSLGRDKLANDIQKTVLAASKSEKDDLDRTARMLSLVQTPEQDAAFRAANPVDSQNLPAFGTPEYQAAVDVANLTVQTIDSLKGAGSAAGKIAQDLRRGLITQDQADTALSNLTKKAGKSLVTVNTGEQIAPTKAVNTDIQKQLLNTQAALDRIDLIAQGFKPEFLDIKTRFGTTFDALRDKFDSGALSKDERVRLREMTAFRRDAIDNLNRTIKDITGAAMSEPEAVRIGATIPKAGTGIFDGDSPEVFKSKMNGVIRNLNRAKSRLMYAARVGLDFKDLPLDAIDGIIDARGNELLDSGMPEEEVEATLKQEFGL